MTDHNLFQEVDEDLERQRLEQLWKRYGPWVVSVSLVIVLATAGTTVWRNWHTARNEEASAGLIHVVDHGDADTGKQMAALETFALKHPGSSQAALAQLDAAGLAAKAGNTERAAQLYDEVAKTSGIDTAFRQLADLLSVRAQADSGDPAVLEKRLQPLEAEGAPWRFAAMELQGYLQLHSGDKAGARRVFTELSQNATVSPSMSARATDMLRLISE